MKRSLIFFLMCSFTLAAAESTVELDPARTLITFTLGDVLHTVHGTFKLKHGSLKFDSATGSFGRDCSGCHERGFRRRCTR